MTTPNPTEDNKALSLRGSRAFLSIGIRPFSTACLATIIGNIIRRSPTAPRRSRRYWETYPLTSNTSPVLPWPTATMSWFMATTSDGDRSPWLGSIFFAWPMARSRNIGMFCRKKSRPRKAPTGTVCSLACSRETFLISGLHLFGQLAPQRRLLAHRVISLRRGI